MQDGANVVRAEPARYLADGLLVGVVEVVRRSEDLDGAGAGGSERIEMARMQSLVEEDVSRYAGDHRLLKVTQRTVIEGFDFWRTLDGGICEGSVLPGD